MVEFTSILLVWSLAGEEEGEGKEEGEGEGGRLIWRTRQLAAKGVTMYRQEWVAVCSRPVEAFLKLRKRGLTRARYTARRSLTKSS